MKQSGNSLGTFRQLFSKPQNWFCIAPWQRLTLCTIMTNGCFSKMTNVTVVSSNKFWHKLLYLNHYRFVVFKTAFRSQKLIFQNKSGRLQRDIVTDWLKFAIFFLFNNWLVSSSFEFPFSIIVLHYFVVHKFLFWGFRYPLAEAISSHAKLKIIKIRFVWTKYIFETFLASTRWSSARSKNLRETQPFAFNLWRMKHVVSHISSNRR